MKLMFASDIHGSASCCEKMLSRFAEENADKLILLGDLLYHGPRNDLPEDYAPKEVTASLNAHKKDILCVRGNCDAQVDQMVLEFPITSELLTIWERGRTFFCTHGHLELPRADKGDVIISGHTHIYEAKMRDNIYYVNTGSISLPKCGNPKSYAVYENGIFEIRDMCGNGLSAVSLGEGI